MSNIIKDIISYSEYGIMMHDLTCLIKSEDFDLTHVYGPHRGGLPIATHLSHSLNLKIILDLDEYIEKQARPEYTVLFCDDVVDSGHTLKGVIEKFKNHELLKFPLKLVSCSLHYKPRSCVKPDLSCKRVSNNTWIVYPWETNDTPDKEYYK